MTYVGSIPPRTSSFPNPLYQRENSLPKVLRASPRG